MSQIQLRVQDARQDDVKKGGIARMAPEDMRKLGLSEGDVLEIVGKKTTSAISIVSEDKERGIIRIDEVIRKNAGVAVNENITVRKGRVADASNIVFAPVDMRLNVDQDFTNFVKKQLVESPRTFVEGDKTIVVMLSQAIPFLVHKTKPNGIVRVVQNTSLQILNEPVPEGERERLPGTTYEDIGGLYEEVRYLREIVELPLRHPELFVRLGIEPAKGILLYGPPGCGKTLLARALANESEVNFFSINGPEIMSKFHGESEARLR
jgi:transitional endoplasmic reticulum ATPase